jgi:hypothetical protein
MSNNVTDAASISAQSTTRKTMNFIDPGSDAQATAFAQQASLPKSWSQAKISG